MIDFTSTRAGASPQDKACAQFLVAIIAYAIRDASQPLTAEERHRQVVCKPHAREALSFLFGPDLAFSAYARLIGSSAESIRRALLQPSNSVETGWMHYPDKRRLALHARAVMENHA